MCFQFTHSPCDDWENICILSYYHHQSEVWTHITHRVRSWNDGVRCMSFYILMNLWYDRIASWDIRVVVVFAPNLALCHWHAALFPWPTDDWHLAYMFSLVYFSVEVCLEGVFPHYLSTRQDSCVRVYAPLTLAPPSRKKNRTGCDPALHLNQARGYLNWRMSLPALLGGNLGCRIV